MSGALAAAWLSAALIAGDPVDAPSTGRQVTRILEQKRYLFCKEDNDYQPSMDDLRFCGLASEVEQRCPGYTKVCERGSELYLDGGMFGSGDEGSEAEKQPGNANEGAYREIEPLELPNLGGFARVLMWLLIIGGVIAIVIVIAKNLIRGRDEEDEPERETEVGADESLVAAQAAAMRQVETDVQRLLARAEQAAARGDHASAITDVYAALLRKLEGAQLIGIEHWKTNGDYLGELRSRPPLRDEVREIVREVEQVQFGAAPAEQGRYVGIRNKVLAVVGRAVLAFALLFGGATMLGCPLFDEEEDALPKSAHLAGLGTSPDGARAVGELLLVHDIEARHRTRSIEDLAASDKAIILLDGVELLDDDWDTLIRWVEEDGGKLLIATGQEFPRELGIDYSVFESDSTVLTPGVEYYYFAQLDVQAPIGRQLELGSLNLGNHSEELLLRPPSQSADEWSYESSRARPYVIRRSLGSEGGEVVVFAEPDLLTNVGISVADNATFLINLLRSRDIDEVEFVNEYTGQGPDDPFESMGNAKLGGLFLQILLFLALLYAAVGIPFARLRDPERQARRSFVEHVRTLGQRYAQARASRYVAGLYSAWALDRLRERLLLGTTRGLHPLAQAIASRTGRDEGQVMQLLVAAHELRENSSHSTRGSAADLELMRQLSKLLDEIGRR